MQEPMWFPDGRPATTDDERASATAAWEQELAKVDRAAMSIEMVNLFTELPKSKLARLL